MFQRGRPKRVFEKKDSLYKPKLLNIDYFIISSLFNGAFSVLECIASMIECLEKLKKTAKNLSEASRSPV
jgi:hypothetical protein